MSFNSWEFIFFLAIVYLAYWALPWRRVQNIFLLTASYYFYAAWDWRFLSLILTSTIVDYICGLRIRHGKSQRARSIWLTVSMVANLGLLGFFKYYGFFLSSLEPILEGMGVSARSLHLHIVLPVGISFYTFQTMSYTIDIYRGELEPTADFLDFALFVAFFPQLVAGPIERAKNLLPQILTPRSPDAESFKTGMWLILWGLWKKIVIADNMAYIADTIFLNTATATTAMMYLGVVAFAWQVYCDFSAYSDIARGSARLLGFELMLNFDLPYFAVNPADLWRRWHISLSTWLRDYLYMPLGGNRVSTLRNAFNLIFTMSLCGLWHGAGWNFVGWGVFNGVGLAVHQTIKRVRGRSGDRATGLHWLLAVIGTFHFFLAGLVIFRCSRRVWVDGRLVDDSFAQLLEVLTSFRNGWGVDVRSLEVLQSLSLFIVPMIILEWFQLRKNDHLFMFRMVRPARAAFAGCALFYWLIWGVQAGESFIYFQF